MERAQGIHSGRVGGKSKVNGAKGKPNAAQGTQKPSRNETYGSAMWPNVAVKTTKARGQIEAAPATAAAARGEYRRMQWAPPRTLTSKPRQKPPIEHSHMSIGSQKGIVVTTPRIENQYDWRIRAHGEKGEAIDGPASAPNQWKKIGAIGDKGAEGHYQMLPTTGIQTSVGKE